eukprot:1321118-Pleurochrysis_carterae.AAC.1
MPAPLTSDRKFSLALYRSKKVWEIEAAAEAAALIILSPPSSFFDWDKTCAPSIVAHAIRYRAS